MNQKDQDRFCGPMWSLGPDLEALFLARHADLKIKPTTSLEKCCAKALNQTAVEGFYEILEKVVECRNISSQRRPNPKGCK
jgi:hypothetical protein